MGIAHGGICNLLINEVTDHSKDFNSTSARGWAGRVIQIYKSTFDYKEDRPDVKHTALTVYEIFTRDMGFREGLYPTKNQVLEMLGLAKWEQNPDVQLDASVANYRGLLNNWMERRVTADEEITHYTRPPDCVS